MFLRSTQENAILYNDVVYSRFCGVSIRLDFHLAFVVVKCRALDFSIV